MLLDPIKKPVTECDQELWLNNGFLGTPHQLMKLLVSELPVGAEIVPLALDRHEPCLTVFAIPRF